MLHIYYINYKIHSCQKLVGKTLQCNDEQQQILEFLDTIFWGQVGHALLSFHPQVYYLC